MLKADHMKIYEILLIELVIVWINFLMGLFSASISELKFKFVRTVVNSFIVLVSLIPRNSDIGDNHG